MDSSDLLKLESLSGWRLCVGYWAELRHGLMGTFPALTREDNQPFLCLEAEVLQEVIEGYLAHRTFKIERLLVLANVEIGLAFELGALHEMQAIGRSSEPIAILNRTRLERLKTEKDPFRWAPGLIGAGEMTLEEVRETLQAALSNGPP